MSEKPAAFWLLRHPPVSGWGGRCYGRLDAKVGAEVLHAACAEVADALGRVGQRFQLYSSPLLRCVSFAHGLHDTNSLTFSLPVVDERLLEIDFGTWEGLHWDEVDRAGVDAWASDPWNYRPGGGESARQMLLRWRSFKTDVLSGVASDPSGLAAVPLLITHAGIVRLAMFDEGLLEESALWLHAVPHAKPLAFAMGPSLLPDSSVEVGNR